MLNFKNNKLIKYSTFFFSIVFALFFTFSNHASAAVRELTGYAWSDGIGWISFNCSNHEKVKPCAHPYSVTYDDATHLLNGFAWNDDLGWLRFENNTAPFPPNSPTTWNTVATSARLLNNKTDGWARFCTPGGYTGSLLSQIFNSNTCVNPITNLINGLKLGGWDGWVSLFGNTYGSVVNGSYTGTFNPATGELKGWWWGGNEFVGWIQLYDVKTDGTDPKLELRLVSTTVDQTNGSMTTNSAWTTNTDPNPNVALFTPAPNLTVPSTQNGVITSNISAEWDVKDMTSCSSVAYRLSANGFPALKNTTITYNPNGIYSSTPQAVINPNLTSTIREALVVTCIGKNSQTYVKTAIFDVWPMGANVNLNASPSNFVNTGGPYNTTLSWSMVNVFPGLCTIDKTLPTPVVSNIVPSSQILLASPSSPYFNPNLTTIPFSTIIKKVTYKLSCISMLDGKTVSDTADVYLNDSTNIKLTADANSFCPGDPITLSWTNKAETYFNCFASTVPSMANGGISGWDFLDPDSSVLGFHLNNKALVSGGIQKILSMPNNGTTGFKLTCRNQSTGNSAEESNIFTVTQKDDSVCDPIVIPEDPEIELVFDNGSTSITNISPDDKVNLKWRAPAGYGPFTSCVGSNGFGLPDWDGVSLNDATQNWSSLKIATINGVGTSTLFKMQCKDSTGKTIYSKEPVTANMTNKTIPAPLPVLSCANPDGWDSTTTTEKTFNWSTNDPNDSCSISIAGIVQSPNPLSSSPVTYLISSPYPSIIKLTCTNSDGGSAYVTKSVSATGACTSVGSGKNIKWIQH